MVVSAPDAAAAAIPRYLRRFPKLERGVSKRRVRHVFLVFPEEADVTTLFSAVHFNYMLFAGTLGLLQGCGSSGTARTLRAHSAPA